MHTLFNEILIFSLCFFCWFLDESRGVFFLWFGGQSAPHRDYFGTLLQLYYTNVGKLKTSVSPRPNITFSSFERLGRNILGNFFQHLFWDGFWVVISLFFWQIEGPTVAPKTTFCEYFRVIFYLDFWGISGGTPNPTSGKGGMWFRRFWST